MFDPAPAAYTYGKYAALTAHGLTKEAIAPFIGAGLMAGARMALPWLARGAASLGRSAMQQLPGAIAQTGAGMAADKLMQPRQATGPASGQMPGLVGGQHGLPGGAM